MSRTYVDFAGGRVVLKDMAPTVQRILRGHARGDHWAYYPHRPPWVRHTVGYDTAKITRQLAEKGSK